MSIIGSIISKAGKGIIDSIGNAIDKNITNKEEAANIKLELEKEVNRHNEALLNNSLEAEKAYLKDVADARALQVAALGQTDLFSKRYIYYLASFIIVAAFTFGIMLFFIEVPEKNKRLVDMFADVFLFAAGITVIQFFFGNSKSSHDKDQTNAIKDAVNK